jgi:hypothetical protein
MMNQRPNSLPIASAVNPHLLIFSALNFQQQFTLNTSKFWPISHLSLLRQRLALRGWLWRTSLWRAVRYILTEFSYWIPKWSRTRTVYLRLFVLAVLWPITAEHFQQPYPAGHFPCGRQRRVSGVMAWFYRRPASGTAIHKDGNQ